LRVELPAGIEGNWYVHVFTAITVGRSGPSLGAPGPGSYPNWPEYFRDVVWEQPDRLNNSRTSAPIAVTYREADLRVELPVDPATMESGGFMTVVHDRNFGTRADAWMHRVFIHRRRSISDQMIGNFCKGVLAR
jgi:hypothetical protein